MANFVTSLYAFNRGIADTDFYFRTDHKRTALSAEVMTNWQPKYLGSMSLRGGTEYLGSTKNNLAPYTIEYFAGIDDKAFLEFTNESLWVVIDDVPLARVSVSSTITNGTFNTDLSGWTDNDEAGAASTWLTGGYLQLVGTGTNSARLDQQVTVSGVDLNKEHGLRIVIERGEVTFSVGSTLGGDDYITQTNLGAGTHSLAFTPTGNFYIRFSNINQYAVFVDSIAIESSGTVDIPTPYSTSDLSRIRYTQENDVIYLACTGKQRYKIERRGTGRSWSLVKYEPKDGSFRAINVSRTSITPSAISGDITLTASKALFNEGHVGALFKLGSIGQLVQANVSAEDTFTNTVRVSGLAASGGRTIILNVLGTWSGTVVLQRSVGEVGSWVDVQTYTGNQVDVSYNDGLDNQIIFYRLGIKTGGYTSGTAELSISYAAGGIEGIAQVTGYTSSTVVNARVFRNLGGTAATRDWYEGRISDYRGQPSVVAIYEGRLCWAGNGIFDGSNSDLYESFDDDEEGDTAPILRNLGKGAVKEPNWLLPLQRLLIGLDDTIKSARSTSFDEVLTNTNFNLKESATIGSSDIDAKAVDNVGFYISKSKRLLYGMEFSSGNTTGFDYSPRNYSLYTPKLAECGFKKVAVQREPELRVHCLKQDGTVAIFLYDALEEIFCWYEWETDGLVKDIAIQRGGQSEVEDIVYYYVERVIDGNTVVYREKWLPTDLCGDDDYRNADCSVSYSGTPILTVTGLDHLEGKVVVLWGDNKDYGTATVTGGSVTFSSAVSKYIIGLGYQASFKSNKLAYILTSNGPLNNSIAITQRKKVSNIGFLLKNTHYQGVKFGRDLSNTSNLPLVAYGKATPTDTIWASYDYDASTFDGGWDTDSRVCLIAAAPRPCTVLGCVIGMETNVRP